MWTRLHWVGLFTCIAFWIFLYIQLYIKRYAKRRHNWEEKQVTMILNIEFGGSCKLRHKHVHLQCNMVQYKDLILNIDASWKLCNFSLINKQFVVSLPILPSRLVSRPKWHSICNSTVAGILWFRDYFQIPMTCLVSVKTFHVLQTASACDVHVDAY